MYWKFITSVMAVCALTACSTGGGNSSSAGSPANNFGIDRRPIAARSVNTPVTVMNTSVDNTVRVENYVNSILPDDWLQRSASIAAANNGRRDGTNPVDNGRGNNEVLANYRAQMAQNQMTELKKLASDFDTRVTEIEPIQLRYAYMLAGGNDAAIDWDTWDTDSDAIIATVGDWFTNHASDVNNIIKTYGDPRQTLADIDFAVMNNDTPFTYKYKIDTKTNAITDIVFDADVAGINAGTEIERDADTNTFTHDNKSVMVESYGRDKGLGYVDVGFVKWNDVAHPYIGAYDAQSVDAPSQDITMTGMAVASVYNRTMADDSSITTTSMPVTGTGTLTFDSQNGKSDIALGFYDWYDVIATTDNANHVNSIVFDGTNKTIAPEYQVADTEPTSGVSGDVNFYASPDAPEVGVTIHYDPGAPTNPGDSAVSFDAAFGGK